MRFEIPDALPVLAKGNHEPGTGKACIMDAISIISGKPQEMDKPSCVHPAFRPLFISVNDSLPDRHRHKLWPLGLRAMGTGNFFAEDGDDTGQLAATVYLKMSQAAYRRASDEPPTVEEHTMGRLLPYVLDCLREPSRTKRTVLGRAARSITSVTCMCDGCEFLWFAATVIRTTVPPSFLLLESRMHAARPEGKLQLLEWLLDGFEAATKPSSKPAPVIDWDTLLRELGTVEVAD